MKRSIKYLPKKTQTELSLLVELVTKYAPSCAMIFLYGSYARGGYVLWDEYMEDGIRYSYQSDYDIMVVVKSTTNAVGLERKLNDVVRQKYDDRLDDEIKHITTPHFIVEKITQLNRHLEYSQYFYTEIVTSGILLYDTQELQLAKPRKLSYQEVKDIAVKYYNSCFTFAAEFLRDGSIDLSYGSYKKGSFELHQASERFYNTISLVFTNYRPKCHDLEKLLGQTKGFSKELTRVFPLNTEFERRCYELLKRAYIEARYNINFVVTEEELTYMIGRVEVLKELTERICMEKIADYDRLICEEKKA